MKNLASSIMALLIMNEMPSYRVAKTFLVQDNNIEEVNNSFELYHPELLPVKKN